jgi:hypothetical protein
VKLSSSGKRMDRNLEENLPEHSDVSSEDIFSQSLSPDLMEPVVFSCENSLQEVFLPAIEPEMILDNQEMVNDDHCDLTDELIEALLVDWSQNLGQQAPDIQLEISFDFSSSPEVLEALFEDWLQEPYQQIFELPVAVDMQNFVSSVEDFEVFFEDWP